MVQMNLEHAAAISNRSSAFVIPQERKEVLLQNTCRKRGKTTVYNNTVLKLLAPVVLTLLF